MVILMAVLSALLMGGPHVEAGKCRVRISATMAEGGKVPIAGLSLLLDLPPGVGVPTVEGSTRVRDSALVPTGGEGASLLVSGNFNAEAGTLAIAMAGAVRTGGDILSLELEVRPGAAVTAGDLNRNLRVVKAAGVDVSDYQSVDLTDQVKVVARIPE